jgi:hypothetical protein
MGRGASSEPLVPGLVRRGLAGALRARERAVILPAVQSLRLASSEGGLVRRWRERSLAFPGLYGEDWQAHSARAREL